MTETRTGKPQPVRIEPDGLDGLLGVPEGAPGIVIFAHGSGSGRLSPRNTYVADRLREAGLATFLLDLLTPAEEDDRRKVFDIDLLALAARPGDRMGSRQSAPVGAEGRLFRCQHRCRGRAGRRGGRGSHRRRRLPRGAARPRGRRAPPGAGANPADRRRRRRAGDRHERGSPGTADLRQEAGERARATHLFEEPGALDQVVAHAAAWFPAPPRRYVRPERRAVTRERRSTPAAPVRPGLAARRGAATPPPGTPAAWRRSDGAGRNRAGCHSRASAGG